MIGESKGNIFVKKRIVYGLITCLVTGALAGCSSSEDNSGNNDKASSAQQVNADGASTSFSTPTTAISALLSKMSHSAQTSSANLNTAGRNAIEIIGADNSGALEQSPDGYKKLAHLPQNKLKKLAKNYQQYDPFAQHYDTTGMDNASKVALSLNVLAASAFTGSVKGEMVSMNVPADAIAENGNTAVADLSYMTYNTDQLSDQKFPQESSGMPQKIHLVKSGNEWKIDGKKTLESFAKKQA